VASDGFGRAAVTRRARLPARLREVVWEAPPGALQDKDTGNDDPISRAQLQFVVTLQWETRFVRTHCCIPGLDLCTVGRAEVVHVYGSAIETNFDMIAAHFLDAVRAEQLSEINWQAVAAPKDQPLTGGDREPRRGSVEA
jgi:hypothetical protein